MPKNFKLSLTNIHTNCFQFLRGEISPWQNKPESPDATATAASYTICGPGCGRLVRPYTSGSRSLKNQLHSTWPPFPNNLAGRPRTHCGGEGAHPLVVERACQRGPKPRVVHKECCSGSDQNITPLASLLLRPSLLVNFCPFLSIWPFTKTSEKNQTMTWVRVPVEMHVFHINKIVIISFLDTLSRSSAQTTHMSHKSQKTDRSTPRAAPSPQYPVNISHQYFSHC